jgi:hypothetical protein
VPEQFLCCPHVHALADEVSGEGPSERVGRHCLLAQARLLQHPRQHPVHHPPRDGLGADATDEEVVTVDWSAAVKVAADGLHDRRRKRDRSLLGPLAVHDELRSMQV